MKKSIRKRLLVSLLFIILFISFTYALSNNYGLEKYYINEKVYEFKKAYAEVDAILQNKNNDNIKTMLDKYSYEHNISIALIDTLNSKAILSNERDGEYLYQRTKNLIFENQEDNKKILYENDNYQIVRHYIKSMDMSFIELIGYSTDNQTMLIMSTSIANLQNSVRISNAFLIYISLFAIILASIFSFYLSMMITKPIKVLVEISNKMRKLDFNTKYLENKEDEIGILGNNMNMMSDTLEKTFSDLKVANEQLQLDIKEKEEIDKVRKDFIANVSHELKTPIALIQGYAEGLTEELCDDIEVRKYYTEVIIDESKKMNVLVSQLLALSAIESGAKLIEIEKFNISDLISGVINSIKILANKKNVELKFIKKDIEVLADEFKIEEVVTNYLSNAINHVYENEYIEVSLEDLGNKVRVSVFNVGKNLQEVDVKNIWDKFYKVDKSHSRSYGGSGIGLSIVKAIMEAHKNKYGVLNRERGVEFWFELDKA